jgi:hypothetical protein
MVPCDRLLAQDEWKVNIAHEHFSAPFDPASGKALLVLKPDTPAK